MIRKSTAILLTSLDDLFTTQAERDMAKREPIIDIPIGEISDFPDHPFRVRHDADMYELADSVRQHGVLVPVLIRPMEDGNYQIVAGHRRKRASELAGKETIPCVVRGLTDDEAIIAIADSNLQREKILPSEKAFAYKMKLDAMKRQGQRTDLTSAPVGEKLTSAQKMSSDVGDSARQIHRFIRLTYLISPLLDKVDEGKIAMRPAVELSYLLEDEQRCLYKTLEREDCTPSYAQAVKMRKFSQDGKLNKNVILSIMQEEKTHQKEIFRMPIERISMYFEPGTPAQKMEDTVIKALELYLKRERSMER